MSWDRGPATFISLDLGCQLWSPSVLCACLTPLHSNHNATFMLHVLVSAQSSHGHIPHTLLIAVSGHPVLKPKVHKCVLSPPGSEGGSEVWDEACLRGARGKEPAPLLSCLWSQRQKGCSLGSVVGPANAWDSLLLWKPT